MPLRPDEKMCGLILERWFLARGQACAWWHGADPPDLQFVVAGEQWDIEVTGIHRQFLGRDGKVQSVRSLSRPLSRIRHSLTDLVRQIHPTERVYSVMINGPMATRDLRRVRELLYTYLRSGSTGPQVLSSSAPCVNIATFPVLPSIPSRFEICLFVGGLAIGAKRGSVQADIRSNIGHTVNLAIGRKLPWLGALPGHNRKALLFYSADDLVEVEALETVLPLDTLTRSAVDAVLLLDPRNEVSVVFDPLEFFPAA